MLLVRAVLLLLLLASLGLGPGFFFVRRLGWSAGEKLCAAIGLSLVFLYLAAAAVYLSGASWLWCWSATAAGIALTLASRRDLAHLLRQPLVRRQLAGFGFLLAVGLAFLSLVQNYSGGMWSGDWLEHYQRTQFFLQRLPRETLFIERYPLPARPPLMNLLGAYLLAHLGDAGFELFQIAFLFMNLLVYFPCVLLAGLMVRFGSRRAWLVAAFLAASPVVLQNATWTWTKLLAAFYVILSVALYLRGRQRNAPERVVAAAASMAAALLVHYSAGPFAVALALHYVWTFRRRRQAMAEVIGAGLAAAALLATWLAWSVANYGVAATVGSNTTVISSRPLTAVQNIAKIGGNIVSTLVPHPLRLSGVEFRGDFQQPNRFGSVRDFFFMICQTNLLFSIGSFAWPAVLLLIVSRLPRALPAFRLFWLTFLPCAALLGVAAHGPPDRFGVAHVGLQPLTLMALTLLAAGFPLLPRWLRGTVAAAAVVDAALGIVLHFRLEMLDIRAFPVGNTLYLPLSKGLLNLVAVVNAVDRRERGIAFFGDHFAGGAGAALALALAILLLGFALWVIAGATSGGPARSRQKPRTFSRVVIVGYILASAVCLSDRAAGFLVASSSGIPAGLSSGDVEQAVASAARAARADPDSAEARYVLGTALYRLAQVEPASDAFLEAFLLDPEHDAARYALNVVLAINRLGLEDTDARFAEAVRLAPGRSAARRSLAETLAARGHLLPARRQRAEADRLESESKARALRR